MLSTNRRMSEKRAGKSNKRNLESRYYGNVTTDVKVSFG